MYKTIMVPLDGSKRAENVLRHVEQLAHCYGAKVILLRVVNLPRIIGYESSELELFHKNFEEKLEEAEDYLITLPSIPSRQWRGRNWLNSLKSQRPP